MVSNLAFYSDDPNSNLLATEFFCTVLTKDENKINKRPRLAGFKKCNLTSETIRNTY